jgi:fumarylacetoacetase
MTPLGPMNGKSFGTSMSPWIITLDALAPFEESPPPRDIPVASYLKDSKSKATYDIHLQADLITENSVTTICKSELKWMYWSLRDLVAQQTVNGCNINTGDVLATGTISGSTEDSHGCLLELTRGGEEVFKLGGGGERMFLNDGDAVRVSAQAGVGVGFGECIGTILSAT